jgi:hypothetical protein
MSLLRRAAVAGTICALVVACRGERAQRAADTARVIQPSVAAPSAKDTATGWDAAAGPALVVSTPTAAESAFVVRPDYVDGRYSDTATFDVRSLSKQRFDLFGRSGFFGTVTLTTGVFKRPGCVTWPTAAVFGAKTGWRAALKSGQAIAVPLDSLEAMSSDSALFAAQVTRLAASIRSPQDSVFSSVPFLVREAYRFRTETIEGIIGMVQRSIPLEATPREDNLMFIAERPIGSTADYRIGFSTQNAGREDAAEIVDVLAMVNLTSEHRPVLIVSYEYDDGNALGFIERMKPDTWRATWQSEYAGC